MTTGTPKILIVSAVLPVLRSTFSRRGFLPEVATSVAAAMDLLSRESFDLILLHPVRPLAGGLHVLERKSTTINRTTPVVLLASREQDEVMERARRLGIWKCVVMQDTSPRRLAEDVRRDFAALDALPPLG